ncbi:hypothetical protein HG536_0A04710 [Torulaspora globosa]|uniref:RING-type domain-containing protein n=1 Tax=Torulaspora globosa TaxID=48254 RepID=A0A7G3ZAW9_9SACH|nr:uncharacterized protein HG536_0A04710 [Torulaspora globosa]QLL30655.1 hypothetical protein HG536_0A04710 [Torulaspora globosa]
MESTYRIALQFPEEEQAIWAYRSFTNASQPPHPHNTVPAEKSCKIRDWRVGDLSISSIKEMDLAADAEDKDLLLSQYLGHGIIRLFRLNEKDSAATTEHDLLTIPGDDTMVSILFVPTYFTVRDLLHYYIGDEIVNNQVSNFRILRNKKCELGFNFMVLMKFKDPLMAKGFKDEFNGKRFSKMDPETCHVVSIKEVVFERSVFDKKEGTEIPYLLSDPFTTQRYDNLKIPAQVELPTCPVCLERMDSETTGLITIPCQHTFHCQCLEKWKNSRCPVCRYSSIRLSRNSAVRQNGENSGCSTCGCHDNLWICLICGNIGCGRYNSKHAIQHYDDTSHCFAMDMQTQRVWDYAGDNYVHRLVQNEVDGKLVEVEVEAERPIPSSQPQSSGHSGSKTMEKDSSAASFMRNKEYHLEYVQVLVSQLESQREFFEMKLQQAQSANTEGSEVDLLRKEIEELKVSFKECQQTFKQQNAANARQRDEDKLVIQGLQENLDHISRERDKIAIEKEQLAKEKQELEEQVHDLMFYLESQEKFKDADASVREGTIIIQDPKQSSTDNNSKPKKKSKSKRKPR